MTINARKKKSRDLLQQPPENPSASDSARSAVAARVGSDRGAGGVPARTGGASILTHSVGNSFGTKEQSAPSLPVPSEDDERYTVANVAKRFGVGYTVMDFVFKHLDQSAGELIVERNGSLIATATGLEKIPELLATLYRPLDAPPAPPDEGSGANGARDDKTPAPMETASKMPAIADLAVVRIREGGHRLTARLPSGAMVVCELQNTAFLMPGMTLKKCVRGWGNIYRYTGKLPRRKGKF